MSLTGKQYEQFTRALVEAFPDYTRLEMMLQFRRGLNLGTIVEEGPLDIVAFDLIRVAEAEGWTHELLLAARESNPGNPSLLALAQQLGLAPAAPPRQELERIINQASGFLDVTAWRQRLGQIEGQVCRVEIPTNKGTIFGTGFLLAPDLVMTNYHVIKPLRDGSDARPEDVIFRFDYRRLADGTTLNPGTEYHLLDGDESGWLVDFSEMSVVDGVSDPKSGDPLPTELDFALVRTAGRPGDDRIGAHAEPDAPPRGWIDLPAEPRDVVLDEPLFIVQHPTGGPLKLALDKVTGWNLNRTRIRYTTNTEPGSSGSPCFDVNWNLVALHQSGDPRVQPEFNQGIPMPAIARLLGERGHMDKLGARFIAEVERTPTVVPALDSQPQPKRETTVGRTGARRCWRTFPPEKTCWPMYTLIGVVAAIAIVVGVMLLMDNGDEWVTTLSDDFSAGSGFAPLPTPGNDLTYSADFRDEQWAMWRVDNTGPGSIQSPDPGAPHQDAVVAVDAQVLKGGGIYVAIACRYNKVNGDRYQFRLDPSLGQWWIQLRVDDVPTTLTSGSAEEVIHPGQEWNRIELNCTGDNISAAINGEQVGTVTNGRLTEGNACLLAGRTDGQAETGPFEVRFDNLTIRTPA